MSKLIIRNSTVWLYTKERNEHLLIIYCMPGTAQCLFTMVTLLCVGNGLRDGDNRAGYYKPRPSWKIWTVWSHSCTFLVFF